MRQALAADHQGFDSVWLGDHLIDYRGGALRGGGPGRFVHGHERDRRPHEADPPGLGMLNPSFRNPAHLAKMLSTLDQLTYGRVICSIGAGWLKPEYAAYDVPFIDDHDERIAHEREVVLLLKELWTRPAPECVTFEGKYVRTRELAFNPAPVQKPHPPIWIGGDSDATVALAKELGDGWVPLSRGEPRIVKELRASPDWPARPMTVVRITWMLVAESRKAERPCCRKRRRPMKRCVTPRRCRRPRASRSSSRGR